MYLSREEMVGLAGRVKDWEVTRLFRYPHSCSVDTIEGNLGMLTIDIQSNSGGSFTRWYEIRVKTELNELSSYKGRDPKLKEIFHAVADRYEQRYTESRRNDREKGIRFARGLLSQE